MEASCLEEDDEDDVESKLSNEVERVTELDALVDAVVDSSEESGIKCSTLSLLKFFVGLEVFDDFLVGDATSSTSSLLSTVLGCKVFGANVGSVPRGASEGLLVRGANDGLPRGEYEGFAIGEASKGDREGLSRVGEGANVGSSTGRAVLYRIVGSAVGILVGFLLR